MNLGVLDYVFSQPRLCLELPWIQVQGSLSLESQNTKSSERIESLTARQGQFAGGQGLAKHGWPSFSSASL